MLFLIILILWSQTWFLSFQAQLKHSDTHNQITDDDSCVTYIYIYIYMLSFVLLFFEHHRIKNQIINIFIKIITKAHGLVWSCRHLNFKLNWNNHDKCWQIFSSRSFEAFLHLSVSPSHWKQRLISLMGQPPSGSLGAGCVAMNDDSCSQQGCSCWDLHCIGTLWGYDLSWSVCCPRYSTTFHPAAVGIAPCRNTMRKAGVVCSSTCNSQVWSKFLFWKLMHVCLAFAYLRVRRKFFFDLAKIQFIHFWSLWSNQLYKGQLQPGSVCMCVCVCVCVCVWGVLIKPHMWMFVAGWAHSPTHGLSWGPHRHRAGLDLSRDQCQQAHTGNTLHGVVLVWLHTSC